MLKTPPIDYDALRVAMVASVAAATGLDSGNVMMLDGENPNWPRPSKPYMALQTITAASKYGSDCFVPDDSDSSGENWIYSGPRAMTVGFDSYGQSHEQANGLMSCWQACLMQEPTLDALRGAGIAVWDVGPVVAMSALLNTAYEGRAHMDVTFGLQANMLVNLGRIETAPIVGQVAGDNGQTEIITTTTTTLGS